MPEKVGPPGALPGKPNKHRARSAGIRQFRGDYSCASKLTSYAELRGCCGPGVPRALVYQGRRGMQWEEACPAAITNNTQAMTHVCFSSPSLERRVASDSERGK